MTIVSGNWFGRQVDDEVVDDDAVALLDDLDRVDVTADAAHGGRDRAQRTGAVGQGDPHQEHATILSHRRLLRCFGPVSLTGRSSGRHPWKPVPCPLPALRRSPLRRPTTSRGGRTAVRRALRRRCRRARGPVGAQHHPRRRAARRRRPLRARGRDRCATWRERRGAGRRRHGRRFTIYRMRFTDDSGAARDIAGVLGGLEVVDEGAGGVLPHERTTPEGLDRSAGPDPGDPGQPVPGLGTVAGLRARPGCSPSRGSRSARWSRTGSSTSSSGSPIPTGSPRSSAVLGRRRRADRRRPPPLQHQPDLPRRGPCRDRSHRHARPSRRWPSSASWSPTSSASPRSTGCTPAWTLRELHAALDRSSR